MGGLGSSTEMHMPDTFPYPDGKDIDAASAAWIISSNTIIAQYAAHLTRTPFVAALAVPFNGTVGTTALQSVVDTSLSLYGSRIGFENWGLNAESSTGYLPNAIIYDHRLTNPVGFQMTGNATTGGGGDLRGTLRQAMEAGVAMGAQYLQVYGDDIANPATPTISTRSPPNFFHRQTHTDPNSHSEETTSSLRKTELVQEGQTPTVGK